MTLSRWLKRAVSAGLACQQGTGRRSDPFRYWLHGQEEKWKQDPLYDFHQMIEQNMRIAEEQGKMMRAS